MLPTQTIWDPADVPQIRCRGKCKGLELGENFIGTVIVLHYLTSVFGPPSMAHNSAWSDNTT